MNKTSICSLALALGLALPTFAAAPDSYQVTGAVLEATDSMIVVQKGKERFEVARDEKTKVEGEVKVGEKVTIYYKMTATKVEVKAPAKTEAKADASGSPAKKKK